MTPATLNRPFMLVPWTLLMAMSLSACSSLKVSDFGRHNGQSWLTEGGSPGRTNAADVTISLPLEEAWVYNAGGAFGPGAPLIAGNHVFVHTRKGEVHAVSTARGKKVGVDGFAESINGSPVLDRNILFVPSAWGTRHGIVAHDIVSGRHRWKFDCPPVDEGLLLLERLLIFSDEKSVVHAVDADTGTEVWQLGLDPQAAVTTTPVLAGSSVVVADDRGSVRAIGARNGVLKWSIDLGDPVYSTPAVSEGLIVVGTTRGSLIALDEKDGSRRWTHRLDDRGARFASPAIRDGRVIVGASDGKLRAVNLGSGSLDWTWHSDGAIVAAPLIVGSQVYFGTMRKSIYALDVATGHELWSAEVDGRVKSAPAATQDAVYFLAEPRNLYKFISTKEASYANGN